MDYNSEHIEKSKKIIEALFAQSGFDSFTRVASVVFENPVFILDSRLQLVSKYGDGKNDQIWSDLARGERYSYSNIRIAKSDGRYDIITESTVPIYIHVGNSPKSFSGDYRLIAANPSNLNYSRIVCNLWDGNTLLGSITVLEIDTEFKPYYISLIDFFSKILVARWRQDRSMGLSEESAFSFFILDLLNKRQYTSKELKEQLSQLKFTAKSFNTVVSITSTVDSPELDLTYLAKQLSLLFQNKHYALYENTIVFLFSSNNNTILTKKQRGHLVPFLRENNLAMSISLPFRSLNKFYDHYEQTITALEIGRKIDRDDVILYYDKYQPHIMIQTVNKDTGDVWKYCHPNIIYIIEHDVKNKSEYFKTLLSCLDNPNNLKAAAVELAINRNTLSYRLEKIQENFGVNIKDPDILQQLYFSISLLQISFGDKIRNIPLEYLYKRLIPSIEDFN